jgi:hypothetical protein
VPTLLTIIKFYSPLIKTGDYLNPLFESKQVLVSKPSLGSFKQMLTTLELPFNYDLAVGFVEKYLFNLEKFDRPPADRVVATWAEESSVCSAQAKYAIVTDFGGFSNLLDLSQKLIQMLGIQQKDCSKTPDLLSRFSSCSIDNLKASLMVATPAR